jgi:AcrR family transcriptional regulator
MARWEPDARGRLERAALELYGERGFEKTTAAAIAERAGLTKRTFFRHFADKREVLFAGEDELRTLLVSTVAEAPAAAALIDVLTAGLQAAAGLVEKDRGLARERARVITASPELRERELIKFASLSSALAGALRERGVDEPTAHLTAEVAVAVFRSGFARWMEETGDRDFPQVLRESMDRLASVFAAR